jgi:hypothetical protein
LPGEAIPAGASVLAASVTQQGQGVQLNWSEARVHFSAGTGSGGHQPHMVAVTYGDQNQGVLCNTDQPLMLADGKFTTAGNVRSGQKLVDRDGQPQEVKQVTEAASEGGVHHIATGEPWKGKPDGHLLLVGGVVAGDFLMQINFASLPQEMKEE